MVDLTPKLYSELASWWPLLSAPSDYAEEAELYRQTLVKACKTHPETLLELGSGGGNNASHLKKHFTMTLVDRSEGMLAVSQELNPECEHIQGDMRTARLERQFDAVFIHDAIMYMTSENDLLSAIQTAYLHCRPSGVALFVPDCVKETFVEHTSHGGHNGDKRSLRYLSWDYDPDPEDNITITDFAYLLRDEHGTHIIHDQHMFGLFPTSTWMQLITESGFKARKLQFKLSDAEGGWGTAFLGTKPKK